MPDTRLYFAYGSNMDPEQIEERRLTYQFRTTALLKDYILDFTRRSDAGYGVADIVAKQGAKVWGVVFKPSPEDWHKLDRYEGVKKHAYQRVPLTVIADGKPLQVVSYEVVNKSTRHYTPGRDYMERILRGARYWRLDADYIAELEKIHSD